MKSFPSKIRRGFTLLELTLAMMIGMAIGSIVLAMLNQQVAFLRIFRAQSFLNEEAPLVSTHVSKLLMNAERFRLHASFGDALTGENSTLAESPVLALDYRQANGVRRTGILSFETGPQGQGLYYYVVPLVMPPGGMLPAPQWAVTTRPANVAFFMESGIIRCRLTGSAGEEIIFSGAMQ